MSIKNDLTTALHFIESNREDLGDKKALDLLLKGIKKVIKAGEVDE
ncbi:hypothetical protein 278BB001_103 [Bacillus phage 278BB001]|nr:hypothetical protein 278BB001_103 [Bacillus phage 278BB001]